jgi:hypothetical protein
MAQTFYRNRDWQDLYENNRTRGWKNIRWVPIPKKLNGDGYTTIMEDEKGVKRKEGPAIFGTFISIIEMAADCNPRGDLLKSDHTPHTFDSIGRICRIIPSQIELTILFCVDKLKWIQIIDLNTNCEISAVSCLNTAECNSILFNSSSVLSSSSVPSSSFKKSKYGKRSKIGFHLFKNCTYFDFIKFRDALPEWSEEKCRHYYESAKNYSEQHNKEYAGWIAAVKIWEKKDREKGNELNNKKFNGTELGPYDKI